MNAKRAKSLRKLASGNRLNIKVLKRLWYAFPSSFDAFENAILMKVAGK